MFSSHKTLRLRGCFIINYIFEKSETPHRNHKTHRYQIVQYMCEVIKNTVLPIFAYTQMPRKITSQITDWLHLNLCFNTPMGPDSTSKKKLNQSSLFYFKFHIRGIYMYTACPIPEQGFTKSSKVKVHWCPTKHVLNLIHTFQWAVGDLVLMTVSWNNLQGFFSHSRNLLEIARQLHI